MTHGTDPALASVVSGRDIDFHPLGIQRVARQRHVVFPADERPHAANRCIHRAQPGRITKAMHHALGIGGHQFAVSVEHGAVHADNDYAVIERAPSIAPVAFIDAAHDRHRVNPGRLAQLAQVTVHNINGIGQQPRMQLADDSAVLSRRQPPDPRRVTWNERFG
ncbi:hypothetical protein D3C76_1177350 [compost metagenome]